MPLFPYMEQQRSDIGKVRWLFALGIIATGTLPLLPRIPLSELNLNAFFIGCFVATLSYAPLQQLAVGKKRARVIASIAPVFSILIVAAIKAPSMPFPSSAALQFVAGTIAIVAGLVTERMRSIMHPSVEVRSGTAGRNDSLTPLSEMGPVVTSRVSD